MVASQDELSRTWPESATKARLHFVSGKGGTGKSTVAAALALALAEGGKRVLLVEVEGRQGIAQLFDVPPLPPQETKVAAAEGGGEVMALAVDIETAFLEYLEMFYNLGFAGRAMRKFGAIEFATTIAPGLRDVLLTGKIKECVIRTDRTGKRVYDAVVVDAPPTGRIGRFLDAGYGLVQGIAIQGFMSGAAVEVAASVAVGSERHGLSAALSARADLVVSIPMRPGVSLAPRSRER